MKSLLILGASDGSLPTFQAARRLGFHTIGVDQRADSCAVGLADEFLHVSTRDTARILAALRDRTDLAGVLAPSSDIALPTVRAVATHFGLPAPSDAVVRASLDKAFFHDLCVQLDLNSYRQVAGSDPAALAAAARTLRLPVLAKPCDGTGGRGIRMCRTWGELDAALPGALAASPAGTVVVEEYVTGEHVTLEGFCQSGRLAFHTVTRRSLTPAPFAVTRYHRLPSGLPADTVERLADLVRRACQRLGYHTGPLDVDAVVTPDGSVEVIEFGARVGGSGLTELVRHGTGVDVVAASIDAAVGLSSDLVRQHPPRPASLTILGATRSGRLAAVPGLAELRAMPEVADLQLVVPVGAEVSPYHQAAAKLGYVVLAADTAEQLAAAEHRLATLALFEIAPGGTA